MLYPPFLICTAMNNIQKCNEKIFHAALSPIFISDASSPNKLQGKNSINILYVVYRISVNTITVNKICRQ